VNFLPLTRPHLWIVLRSSGSLVSAISAENGEFSQDNRNSACKRAHQGLDFGLRRQAQPLCAWRCAASASMLEGCPPSIDYYLSKRKNSYYSRRV
jgi:hypothetical protein